MKTHQIPEVLLLSFLRHVAIIANHVDSNKPKVADAVRLSKKEIKKIESLILTLKRYE